MSANTPPLLQSKCAKYWPDEEYTYGSLRVSLLTDTLYPNFIERTFEVLPQVGTDRMRKYCCLIG